MHDADPVRPRCATENPGDANSSQRHARGNPGRGQCLERNPDDGADAGSVQNRAADLAGPTQHCQCCSADRLKVVEEVVRDGVTHGGGIVDQGIADVLDDVFRAVQSRVEVGADP